MAGDRPTFVRATASRGLDKFGIPAQLLHALGARFERHGVTVGVKGRLFEKSVLVSDTNAFYRRIRESGISNLHMRVSGPNARDVCRELCALVDVGDPASLLRVGFIEVPWTAHPGFLLCYLHRHSEAATADVFVKMSKDHPTQPLRDWMSNPLFHLDTVAKYGVYCPTEDFVKGVRSWLDSRGPEASRSVRITNPLGIHTKTGSQFVRAAARFKSDVTLETGEVVVNGKSIIGLMSVVGEQGSQLVIQARGSDADAAVEDLAALVDQGFGEEPR